MKKICASQPAGETFSLNAAGWGAIWRVKVDFTIAHFFPDHDG
jgi:hypothetical protein